MPLLVYTATTAASYSVVPSSRPAPIIREYFRLCFCKKVDFVRAPLVLAAAHHFVSAQTSLNLYSLMTSASSSTTSSTETALLSSESSPVRDKSPPRRVLYPRHATLSAEDRAHKKAYDC